MAHIKIPAGPEPERQRLWHLVPPMRKAIVAFSDAMYNQRTLSVREIEVARMRIAQINDCDI